MTGAATTRARVISVPQVLDVSRGNLARVADILHHSVFPLDSVLLVSGPGPTLSFASTVLDGLHRTRIRTTHSVADVACFKRVDEVADEARAVRATLVVGVGGGRVLDVAKSVARACRIDVVSIPTSISHDGISSPVSSLLDTRGTRQSTPSSAPAAVIIDVDVIEMAPLTMMRAGVGDLLSNLSAIEDWRLADARGQDTYDGYSALIADGAARLLLSLEGLARHGGAETLARGLILSGLAMVTAGTSRPCSGAEHLISHALDELLAGEARAHGMQVALGTLIASTARGLEPPGMRAAYERFGLPLHPDEVGLTMQLMTEAVLLAPRTRPERYTVLDEIELDRSSAAELVRNSFVP